MWWRAHHCWPVMLRLKYISNTTNACCHQHTLAFPWPSPFPQPPFLTLTVSSFSFQVTDCLLEIKKMVYTGQGRSKLSSTLDGVTKAPYRCATCGEKFPRSDQLKYHMCDNHPELIEPGLRALLMKMRKWKERKMILYHRIDNHTTITVTTRVSCFVLSIKVISILVWYLTNFVLFSGLRNKVFLIKSVHFNW